MSIGRKAVSGTVWIGTGNIISRAIVFATGIVMARILSPEVFGQFAMAIMAVNFLTLFQNPGISQELVQRDDQVERASDTAFTMSLIIGAGLTLVAAAAAPLLARFYGIGIVGAVTAALGLRLLVSSAAIVPGSIIIKRFKYRQQFGALVLSQAAYAVTAIGVGLAGGGIWSLVAGHLAMAAGSTALLWLAWGRWPRLSIDLEIAREIWEYGKHLALATIAIFAYTNLDNLFIGKVRGAEQLGYYTLAYTLATMPAFIISGIGDYVMFPLYCQAKGEGRELAPLFFKAYRAILVGILPLLAVLLFNARDVIAMLYGAKWQPSVPLLRILLLLAFCQGLSANGGSLLLALRQTKWFGILAGASVVVVALAGYPVVLFWGARGIALLFSMVLLVNVTVMLGLVSRHINARIAHYITAVVPVLIPALVVAAAATAALAALAPLPKVIIVCCATYLMTFATVYALVPEFRADIVKGLGQVNNRLGGSR